MKSDQKHLKSSKGKGKAKQKYNKEYKQEQREKRLIAENKKLKRQVAQLRKIIDRIDLERYHNLRDVVLQQESENQIQKAVDKKKSQEKAWKCHHCPDGILRLKFFENRTGVRYYRKCDGCPHRTKAKEYTEKVEGIE